MAVPEERMVEEPEASRPQPVINRALAAAVVQILITSLGLQIAPELQSAFIEIALYIGLPAILAVVTLIQAKLAAAKVTPVSRPVIKEGRRVLVRAQGGKLYKAKVQPVERR